MDDKEREKLLLFLCKTYVSFKQLVRIEGTDQGGLWQARVSPPIFTEVHAKQVKEAP